MQNQRDKEEKSTKYLWMGLRALLVVFTQHLMQVFEVKRAWHALIVETR
jgi:hypothetical protein